jgi:phage regulator Rha-like protein
MELDIIASKIYEVRGQRVMLDADLAEIYGIETKVLNQSVRRNKDRFPQDFMFILNESDLQVIRSQFVTALRAKRNISALPYAFTEHGVTMLASVLRSETAIKMNIAIVRAFIAMRQSIVTANDVSLQLEYLKTRISNHDVQLNEIYTVIENLLDEKASQQDWKDRDRIGFK